MSLVGHVTTDSLRWVDAGQMGQAALSLTAYVAVLEDPSLQLTLADVQQPDIAARFQAKVRPAAAQQRQRAH